MQYDIQKNNFTTISSGNNNSISTKVIKGYKVGDTIEDFKLKNIDDKMVSLSDYSDAKDYHD